MDNNNKRIIYVMAGLTFILFITAAAYTIIQKYKELQEETAPAATEFHLWPEAQTEVFTEDIEDTGQKTGEQKNSHKDNKEESSEKNIEESIFTYLQGPKSWSEKRDWSGSWGSAFYDGSSFGAFGCGLCCLANVYSTVSSFQCTPADMYRFAKRNTEYRGGGAIAWEYMDSVLASLGLQSVPRRKPDSYSDFKKQISEALCSIVLVSSDASKCYWQDTPGHYVTLFLYNKKDDTVFLADSGDPGHNRHWVELRKIYKSLKVTSEWQYLCVGDYNKEEDTWKHKALNGTWVKPDYIAQEQE
ncbi:MAG TPA: hypothetical protein DCZ23_00080 [Lachnospiraceae bacterium]|nr:hypothetical protein [Lachnospiraceae bacterium]